MKHTEISGLESRHSDPALTSCYNPVIFNPNPDRPFTFIIPGARRSDRPFFHARLRSLAPQLVSTVS